MLSWSCSHLLHGSTECPLLGTENCATVGYTVQFMYSRLVTPFFHGWHSLLNPRDVFVFRAFVLGPIAVNTITGLILGFAQTDTHRYTNVTVSSTGPQHWAVAYSYPGSVTLPTSTQMSEFPLLIHVSNLICALFLVLSLFILPSKHNRHFVSGPWFNQQSGMNGSRDRWGYGYVMG